MGNLTRDPEMRSSPSGTTITTFSIATNRVYNDKDGNRQESAEFHNVVVFGRQAENSAQYLKKGQSALVEGRLQTRSWDDQDGNKKYRTEIVAASVQFGQKSGGGGDTASSGAAAGAAGGAAAGASAENSSSSEAGSSQESKKEELETIEYPDEDEVNPEDIPF